MLTTFYFDQELFDDSALEYPAINNAILESWRNYGCLAVCTENSKNIISAINKVPLKYKQRWITALSSKTFKKTKVRIDNPVLSTLSSIDDFKENYFKNDIITGILPSDYNELFTTRTIDVSNHHLEIINPTNINESINFTTSKDSCEQDIKANEDFSELWCRRFDGLAKHTSIITIIDRYMALNIEYDLNRRKATSLERLIEKLFAYDKKFVIDIYSACDIPNKNINASSIKSYIESTVKKKPYYKDKNFEIRFSLCKDRIFKTKAHDRMMCFDDHVVQIGKGMEIFRSNPIENNTFTIKARRATFFDEAYKELTKNRDWVYR
ncbi:hypothetical protein NX722_15245 [Endozoicomonas gorgoniicola]|uniref:Uncharacterized protein n=1 Tax=Endozoicomonas gorgoniicola TaxID=1234144 RepID=A0ABT3MX43_9GAMM|nr:hypothetical protein [Endozoicomonas gorgoniicola]MCW7553952.1 hypothetical protein [Endozoicomonas gorgoniicola]